MPSICISRGRRLVILVLVTLSLCDCYSELDWREIASEQGRYRITLPSKPHEETRTLNGAAGAVKMTMTSAKAADWLFAVAYVDYPAGADLQFHLDEQRDALLRNISGHIIRQSVAGAGGRILAAEGLSGETILDLRARFVIDGNRLYQIAAIGSKGSIPATELDTFLDSFKLQN